MAKKSVTYKEPAGYFNSAMRKEAEKWDKENAGKKPAAKKKPTTTKKK